jgi:NAD(P)-dependent dehydrogenase (short-subunit alcohol dehydrogenase family)
MIDATPTGAPPAAALVTGAGRRIGRALAEGLADDGWAVAIHYHLSRDPAEELAGSIRARGGKATAIGADLGRPEDCARLVAEAAGALGALRALVNNASLFAYDDIKNIDAANFDRHMAVNARAPLLLAHAFAAQAPSGVDCCIVNLLDQKLVNPNPDFLSYTLSKYALAGMTELLAMALAPAIRVCGLAPGLTLPSKGQTESAFRRAHQGTPLGASSTVGDIVQGLRYLLAARAVTGHVLLVDGGQHLVRRGRDVMFEGR